MLRKSSKWLAACGVLVMLAMLFLAVFLALPPDAKPDPPFPNPNANDDFVRAGQMLAADPEDIDALDKTALRILVSSNATAVSLVRTGLTRECRVPLEYSANDLDKTTVAAGRRDLALAMAAEGKLDELENRRDDAAKCYLDILRFGDKSSRGGLLYDHLIGVGIEALGTDRLQKLAPGFDEKSCRETAAAIEEFNRQRRSWQEVIDQENRWNRCVFPGVFNRMMIFVFIGGDNKKAKQAFNNQERKIRQLMLDLAARAYELKNGRRPASTSDLVPGYLKAIPTDPFTGRKMTCTP